MIRREYLPRICLAEVWSELRGVLLEKPGKLDLFSIDLVHTSGRGSFLEDPIVLDPTKKVSRLVQLFISREKYLSEAVPI